MKFTLIAGEPSGDRLGAALMAALKTLRPDVQFRGIGGPLMQAEGLVSLFPMEELSVMGIAEILPKYRALKRRIAQAAAATLAENPAALITIDSPDFCLRVAKLVKTARPDLKTIHYVAPSVWAWRPGRAAKMARYIDHVLALLPFEPPLMTAAGMTCDFVGHPVVSEPLAPKSPQDSPLILTLPGSRRGEVSRLCPVIGEVLAKVKTAHPTARVALPTVRGVADLTRELTRDWAIQPDIIEPPDAKHAAFANATVAIAASGTVSLELAANGCPMVIAYKMNPLTMWMMQRVALVDTVTLVNLVSQTRAVPEFLGPACKAENITPPLLALMQPGPARTAQIDAMALTMQRLGQGGEAPNLRAARSVLNAL
ncbi:lipid-A-disaccharide synthase (plasmid) [Pseudorhodobacter turbinis]|uniref:Lipid-A-disaccharide synthase n=1 Tax=Pseudorhodobacter turbinis TaxID=2500533 RepID=A0A4P8EJ92_9RHOB|nr:lipid-A-disaccharide synthase [Pseudorhodobacter turbinis]QCO56903.1 lipid-A-disaccharide synthase [Pseudorhodobacter turbinis]